MNKLVIVLIILLAGCILVSSSTAADIDVQSIDSDSYVSAIEQNSLNDLNDSNVEAGTKNTGDDKYVTNLKAKNTDDKDISKLGATKSFRNLNTLIKADTTGTLTLSADDVYKYDSSVDSAYQNGITINKTIVIDGNGCTIDGLGIARAFQITGANVTIKNINFINTTASDGGAILWNGANGTVKDCSFTDCFATYDGGAIYWNYADGAVSGCTFTNCSATSDGGAIYWSSVGGTVSSADFVNCSANKNGPAIYIASAASLNISDSTCTPIDNRAPIYNDGTILSPVVITTLNGTDKSVTYGDHVDLIVNVTTSDILVAGGKVTLTVNNTNKDATSDIYGIYSTNLNRNNYTVDFVGTKPVTAKYLSATGGQTVNDYNLIAANATGSFKVSVEDSVYGSGFTINVTDAVGVNDEHLNGTVVVMINGKKYTVSLTDGKGSNTTTDVLSVGEYPVSASLTVPNYNVMINTTKFNVTNATGSFKVSVEDSVYGSGFTINVTDAVGVNDEHLNGTVIVTIEGKEYNVTLNNGEGSNTTSDVWPVGKYDVSASLTVPNYNVIINSTKFNVTKFSPSVSITTCDIDYGDDLSVNVTVTGIDSDVPSGNVTILVNGTEYANKTLTGGECEFIISDLAAGDYNITVVYNGNDNYNSSNSSANIAVRSVPAQGIDIIVNTPEYGDDAVVNVSVIGLDGKAVPSGNVTILVNGTEYDTVPLTSGNCSYTIPTILVAGDYNITVVYNGDNNYTGIEDSAILTVIPKPIDVDVVINNATYGDDTISGVVNASMNGTVTVVIDNSTSINVTVNESGEFTIPLKLPAGVHDVNVTFLSADGNYKGDSNVSLNIAKAEPQVIVDIGSDEELEIKFGDTVVSIVDVPDDATGVVYFSLDNETWVPVNIPEDSNLVEFDIPDLDAGNYILFVKYSGDGNYDPVYSENPFTVNQLNTVVSVDPVKGKAGEKVTITVRVTDERGNPVEEGTVIIKVNGKEYEANVVNGIATVEVVLPDKAGTYSVTVCYEGFNYNISSSTFTVDVSDVPGPNPNPNPTPVNNGVGNMENTGNPLFVLLVALCAIGLESFRRKF